jgi:hypothetical protein
MALSISQIINIAKISEYLSALDKVRSGLFGGGTPENLPNLIYNIRKAVERKYNQLVPDNSLTNTSNYLLAICGKFGFAAQYISGTGGSIVPPTPGGTGVNPYLIKVVSADFATPTRYNDVRIIGKSLVIFWNDISRYLDPSEFTATSTGVEFLMDGFDASTNSYTLYIYLLD